MIQLFFSIERKTPVFIFQWLNTVQWTDHYKSNSINSIDPRVTKDKAGRGALSLFGVPAVEVRINAQTYQQHST